MALATRSPQAGQRRIWKAPASQARWFWLAVALVLYGGIFAVYLYAIKTQPFPGPFNDPLRSFGIIAFLLVLTTASYSLRRRFARNLPGKAQDWLWMHTWLGVTAILVALLHENFKHILHDYCANASCLTSAYGGSSALIALFVLVLSGIVGRLLDSWQARRIAQDASANGVGIARAIDERLLELEYTIERLCAGKSEAFQGYCLQTITNPDIQQSMPTIDRREREDFERAQATLAAYASLARSQRSQQQARRIFRAWRIVHMILAALALLIILIHSIMELLVNVFHLISPV
jgi:heme/copper-type cytochrome/quinol oxidase subunit 3